ncbi:MAG TPA: ABC transporter ATP-binding protein [Methanothrix sp.]|jgi:ABC-type branched-subunit amino acid transport system ATPase component|nr:ABC transporter ATP-binding protein [Methanothrix sp.]
MLRLESVTSGYTDENIIHEVTLEVEEGEIVSIIGPNGSGKSTLMKSVFGLTRMRGGRIRFLGQDVTGKRPDELVRLGLAYVPQERNVFSSLTVKENLEMGGVSLAGEMEERLEGVLELFPRLAERLGQRAGTLSGGEQKMLAVGRAMVTRPSLLMLDEPSAALSPKVMGQLFAEIEEINRRGVTILMVEQNARRALAISDRGYILEMGRNRFQGPAKSLLDNPEVCSLYLGRR